MYEQFIQKDYNIIFDCEHNICIFCYEKILNNFDEILCPICRKVIESNLDDKYNEELEEQSTFLLIDIYDYSNDNLGTICKIHIIILFSVILFLII